DLKRAYRIRARQYHPDLNSHPDAADIFIRVTEAYELLYAILSPGKMQAADRQDNRDQQREEYIRQRARERAEFYSRIRYENFTRSTTYRTTRIFDGTTIIYGMIISLLIIGVDIYSYTWQMSIATTHEEEPSTAFMLMLLVLGVGFFAFSYLNLLSFVHGSRKKEKQL
ncbi:MAG: DnaJ domain-containing protein, partial [Bacteroidales bacterium]|nr:DnaJ domain-containing protein [Bacteroidales bacterium]